MHIRSPHINISGLVCNCCMRILVVLSQCQGQHLRLLTFDQFFSISQIYQNVRKFASTRFTTLQLIGDRVSCIKQLNQFYNIKKVAGSTTNDDQLKDLIGIFYFYFFLQFPKIEGCHLNRISMTFLLSKSH